jgi:hypothetical protein
MAKADTEYEAFVRHSRRMLRSKDAFTILVRGAILLDIALERAIDAYAAQGWKKLSGNVRQLMLHEKAHLAMALGAIHNGELDCITKVNGIRNGLAHQIDVDVNQGQEWELVKLFRASTKLFSGLNYDPKGFPGTLAFLLFTLAHSIGMRQSRSDARIRFRDDKTNTEHMAAIISTTALSEIISTGVESDDTKVLDVIRRYVDEATRRINAFGVGTYEH